MGGSVNLKCIQNISPYSVYRLCLRKEMRRRRRRSSGKEESSSLGTSVEEGEGEEEGSALSPLELLDRLIVHGDQAHQNLRSHTHAHTNSQNEATASVRVDPSV